MTHQVTENPTLISPDNIQNIETIKGTIDTKVETKKDKNNSHNDKANTTEIHANHKPNTLVHILEIDTVVVTMIKLKRVRIRTYRIKRMILKKQNKVQK